ncbi:MAG: histidinol-phosphate transaminase [Azospirillum brasilense]|nr:MAG: histidinol-phosphate transaminase [Azospirillum brasilense]
MAKHPTPKAGITAIAPYVGGKSKVEGVSRVIKLSSNENPWGPSPRAIAAFNAQAASLHRYPDGGHAALREAIARAEKLPEAELICGAGSDELLGLTVHAYAGPGDEVLFTEHGFLMYRIYTQANGATPVTAPESNLSADVDALLAAVTPRTKIVFLANPNNPTGTVIPFSEIRRLRAGLREDIILGLDAAYAEYLDHADYEAGHSLVHEGTNTIVFHTFSKIHGLPALRLGYAHAPAHIIDILNRVRSPFNVNSAALAAGIAAIEDSAYVAEMRARNAEQLARVSDAIRAYGYNVVPSVTNFILVHVGAQAKALNEHLAARGLIIREVGNYGLPEFLRISIGTAEENDLLLAAVADFAKSHAA